ncbi:hypothetical protein DFH09DRAFT_197260 [Mycena vulgaris]|nr:hypothetical protein DFH09DRAFT_197260 [Mycena vulgaris]
MRALIVSKVSISIISREIYFTAVAKVSSTIIIVSLSPQLGWLIWTGCYLLDSDTSLLFVWDQISPRLSLLSYRPWVTTWQSFSLAEKSMIIGPAIIQGAIAAISSACLILLFQGLGSIFSVTAERRLDFLCLCAVFIAGDYACDKVFYPATFYRTELMHPVWKYPFLSRRWRKAVRNLYLIPVRDYRTWKSAEWESLHDTASSLHMIVATTFNSCLETWGTLCCVQKLLIVAPAVIYYSYFYMIPAGRRLPRLIRKWRRR